MPITTTHQQDTALFVAAFFDEMVRWGVCEVVVSPGSRSTALAMAAYELEQRRPQDLRVYVDIDERGAAFLGLGLAKASGRPVALVCTSGTALANYYPAVIEAETSRVPLIVLSGDRPPQLQGLGAPQDHLHGERLRHVVVAAGAEADALVHDVALRRQEDHRDAAALLADARAEIEAVRARQHHVQQQQIGMLAGQQLQPAFRIPSAAERVAVRHQQLLERLPQVALVVDDHDLIHRPPPLSRPRSRSRES